MDEACLTVGKVTDSLLLEEMAALVYGAGGSSAVGVAIARATDVVEGLRAGRACTVRALERPPRESGGTTAPRRAPAPVSDWRRGPRVPCPPCRTAS